jgi:DNA polymerase elongation subunit (family B)
MSVNMVSLDIETDTAIDGLDPQVSTVVSVGLWAPSVQTVIEGVDEVTLLHRLVEVLDDLPESVVVGWNSSVFDFPFLATRAEICGVDLDLEMVADPAIVPKYCFTPPHTGGYRVRIGRHRHADIAYAYQAYAEQASVTWSLKPVCTALDIEMVKVDASQIHLLSREELIAYNLSDVRGTYLLAERLGDEFTEYIDSLSPARAG